MDPHDLKPTRSALSVEVWPDLRHRCAKGWRVVVVDEEILRSLQARADLGVKRYGQLLLTHDGRDGLRDLREELLDAIVYNHKLHLSSVGGRWKLVFIFVCLCLCLRVCDESKTPVENKSDGVPTP